MHSRQMQPERCGKRAVGIARDPLGFRAAARNSFGTKTRSRPQLCMCFTNKANRCLDSLASAGLAALNSECSTTEQEAVATWPFRYHSTKACVLRIGQVATASCSVVECIRH